MRASIQPVAKRLMGDDATLIMALTDPRRMPGRSGRGSARECKQDARNRMDCDAPDRSVATYRLRVAEDLNLEERSSRRARR